MTGIPAPRRIRARGELASLIREIKGAIAAGLLEQVPGGLSGFAADASVDDISEQGPWPDYVELRLRAREGGRMWRLTVETYHGAGGDWAPE